MDTEKSVVDNSPNPSLDQYPKKKFWDIEDLSQCEGFWYLSSILPAVKNLQAHFVSRDDDIFLASSMKTGTNWLKALCTTIMQGQKNDTYHLEEEEDDPLVKNTPNFLVQTIEVNCASSVGKILDLSDRPSPRLFHTHIPYKALPDSIKNSSCKIIYITRNPKDTLVSMWHFFNTISPKEEPYPFDKAFENFCDGFHPYGPFLEHVLEYWEVSLEMPHKILFLKYEDMKRDPKREVKRLASFLGKPFANEQEVDKVLWRCSLERIKNLEVNKEGVSQDVVVPNSSFFRLGAVGDWKNNFSTEMQERLDQINRQKLENTSLELEI